MEELSNHPDDSGTRVHILIWLQLEKDFGSSQDIYYPKIFSPIFGNFRNKHSGKMYLDKVLGRAIARESLPGLGKTLNVHLTWFGWPKC